MLVRRGFWWLIGAALAGLLTATLLAGHAALAVLEDVTLERMAGDAARLATAPATLPADALLMAPDGTRLGGDLAVGLPPELAAAMAPSMAIAPLRFRHAAGLLAAHPVAEGAGAIVLWQPSARTEARLATIMLRGLRDAALLFLLGMPAAWIGARLSLAPLADAASQGTTLLDTLCQTDGVAATSGAALDTTEGLHAASPDTDPLVAAAVAAAGRAFAHLATTERAILQQAMAEAVA